MMTWNTLVGYRHEIPCVVVKPFDHISKISGLLTIKSTSVSTKLSRIPGHLDCCRSYSISTMKLTLSAVAFATVYTAAALSSSNSATAFQPTLPPRGSAVGVAKPVLDGGLTTLSMSTGTDNAAPPCAMPNEVIPDTVTAKALRSAVLTNANGETVRLDDKMGSGTSIVIFLRHLG